MGRTQDLQTNLCKILDTTGKCTYYLYYYQHIASDEFHEDANVFELSVENKIVPPLYQDKSKLLDEDLFSVHDEIGRFEIDERVFSVQRERVLA